MVSAVSSSRADRRPGGRLDRWKMRDTLMTKTIWFSSLDPCVDGLITVSSPSRRPGPGAGSHKKTRPSVVTGINGVCLFAWASAEEDGYITWIPTCFGSFLDAGFRLRGRCGKREAQAASRQGREAVVTATVGQACSLSMRVHLPRTVMPQSRHSPCANFGLPKKQSQFAAPRSACAKVRRRAAMSFISM